MKKFNIYYLLLLVTIISVSFASCNSDDDDEPSGDIDIVGFWIRYEDNDQFSESFGFFSDGSCNYTQSYEPDDPYEEAESEFGEGSYRINGNKLSVTLHFDTRTDTKIFTIKSIKAQDYLVLMDEDGDTYRYLYYAPARNHPVKIYNSQK